ncbi:hypothetical protein ACJJTC_017216 [Scirpophaga incertulas]
MRSSQMSRDGFMRKRTKRPHCSGCGQPHHNRPNSPALIANKIRYSFLNRFRSGRIGDGTKQIKQRANDRKLRRNKPSPIGTNYYDASKLGGLLSRLRATWSPYSLKSRTYADQIYSMDLTTQFGLLKSWRVS